MPKISEVKKQDQLYPYQQEGVEFLRSRTHAYLGDDMGLGKSVQLIRASQGKTLVVAPAMLIDSGNWQNEIDRWADDPSRFTLTAYTRLPGRNGSRMSNQPRPEFDQDWDTVVFDEAHYLKNRNAIRTQVAKRITRRAKRVYLASGTPIPNWAHELFVPFQMLHPDEDRAGMTYGSYWNWVEKWFRVSNSPFSRGALEIGKLIGCTRECSKRPVDDPCDHYLRFARENFRGTMIRRLRDEVLDDLPDLHHQRVPVAMTTKQWKAYRDIREECIAGAAGSELVAWSAASQHTYLDQITTSLGMLSEDPLRDSGKFERLAMDLENRTHPTVVVGHFKATVDGVAQVAQKLGKTCGVIHGMTPKATREQVVRDFQAGKIDVLAGTYDTISEGLTLTAADLMILVEISYKAARNQQVIRRIHRIGQERKCMVLEYYATGTKGQKTLDSAKRDLVDRKILGAGHALSAATLKEIL